MIHTIKVHVDGDEVGENKPDDSTIETNDNCDVEVKHKHKKSCDNKRYSESKGNFRRRVIFIKDL